MPLIDASAAREFGLSWIAGWNAHDLDAVLSHYSDDIVFSSPLIVELLGDPGGVLRGKSAIRAYWAIGLQRLPDLHFQLLDVLAGIDQVIVYYQGHRGTVMECCQFDAAGLVVRAAACYTTARPTHGPLVLPALDPLSVIPRTVSIYPIEELRQRTVGRAKRALGDALGLQTFGVNRVTLAPGAISALRHWHSRQDEFIYVLEGEIVLRTEDGEQLLRTGSCAGFQGGKVDGHQLINRSNFPATYLEVGDRLPGDQACYPDDDLKAAATRGSYVFVHKNGEPY